MRTTKILELSLETFNPYGTFANMINPKALKIGDEPIEFFRDLVPLELGGAGRASFSVCRVVERPLVVDVSEYHDGCGEGILPLDGDALIHVGPATPPGHLPLEQIKVFRVPLGTFVSLRPGVWHHAPFAYGSRVVNVLIVLPERTYANDCRVQNFEPEERIEIRA